jgi:hypothetical protein
MIFINFFLFVYHDPQQPDVRNPESRKPDMEEIKETQIINKSQKNGMKVESRRIIISNGGNNI